MNTATNNTLDIHVLTSSNSRTYPEQPLFLIIWAPWKVDDDYDDRLRIYGIYSDEAESKRVFDLLRGAPTDLNKRGGFCWMRCKGLNLEPSADDLVIDFELPEGSRL